MSKAHRINKNEIKNLPILVEGYKIFDQDWKCMDYCYADENGTAVGTVHKVEGKLSICINGFHFCKKLEDCFEHYEPVQYNKIAKVRAYDEVIDWHEKSCCSIIEIVEELHWDDIHIKDDDNFIYKGINNVYTSKYVGGSENVKYSTGIYGSSYINNSIRIIGGYNIVDSQSIRGGTDISYAHSVYGSCRIIKSLETQGSIDVQNSCYLKGCDSIQDSYMICGGNEVYYSQCIWGGYFIYFSANLRGAYNCMFCLNLNGAEHQIFNKKVSRVYFNQVCRDIFEIIRYTKYYMTATNYEELYNKYGNLIPINQLKSKCLDYSKMPQELLNYIKNLPEYNDEIFNKIINYDPTNITF